LAREILYLPFLDVIPLSQSAHRIFQNSLETNITQERGKDQTRPFLEQIGRVLLRAVEEWLDKTATEPTMLRLPSGGLWRIRSGPREEERKGNVTKRDQEEVTILTRSV
jgi:hypothetical protein